MSERVPPVVVAVVSWNTRELLGDCLRSLHGEVTAGRADVWVVDNGSSDGSPDLVRREAPWAKLVEPGENLGFGAAVDLVADKTTSEWIAAANADVAVEPAALERLLDAGGDPRVGAVAPRLVLPDGQTQHSVYPFPTLPFTLLFNLGLHRLSRRWGDRLCLEGYWDPDRPRDVDWAIGAFLVIRRTAFQTAGRFDARQWLFAEDLDLGWRLARAGYTTRYVPDAKVRHHASAATSGAFGDEKVRVFMAATYSVLTRRRGRVRSWITAAVNCLGAAVRLAWMWPLSLVMPRWEEPRDLNRRWLAAHREGLTLRSGEGHR